METNPVISVIVPVYKAEEYLPRCIDSIIAQTFVDFEVLLIDDGSPDNSGKICDDYAIKDKRIRVFHKSNGGVSSARNLGLDEARGRWVMFVDADDWLCSDCLKECIFNAEKKLLDVLQFSYVRVDNNGVELGKEHNSIGLTPVLDSRRYIQENKYLVVVWGACIRYSLIKEYNIRFDENIKLAEDQLFIMEVLANANKVQRIDSVLYYYLDNPTSATNSSKSHDMLDSIDALIEFKKRHSIFVQHIDEVIVMFITLIIQKHDVACRKLRSIYNRAQIGRISSNHRIMNYFSSIAKCDFKLAFLLLQLYSNIKNNK